MTRARIWGLMPSVRSVPLLATQGRGRPKKYGRPARAVTVTLPEDILATLNAADTDLGRAIVKLVERRGKALAIARKPPAEIAKDLPMNGSLFIGDKGKIAIAHDGMPKLLPEEQFKDFKGPDPFLPKSPGHHAQWLAACKTGSKTGSNFGYAGPFTEIVLLGNVAYRVGKTIEYDPATMKVTNIREANALQQRTSISSMTALP